MLRFVLFVELVTSGRQQRNNMNTLFQNALARKVQNTPPVWFMRQAGRYHKHYQNMRKNNSFYELCKNPELAAEVAMGPIMDFDFDVAILFSDILFPLEALGMGLTYSDQKGPQLGMNLSIENIHSLNDLDKALPQMNFQAQAMQATRARLPSDKSLIGFVGGLWTLFVYAVEGSHSGNLIQSKKMAPFLFPEFLKKMKPLITENISMQLKAGAEIVMIFDTACGETAPSFFKKHLAASLIEIANQFPGKVGYYSKGTQASFFEESFLQAPWAGMGFDHRWNLKETFKIRPAGFVQGNFDQSLLHQKENDFKESLENYILDLKSLSAQERAGWVSGLGHGVLPNTPEEHVRFFVQQIRKAFA